MPQTLSFGDAPALGMAYRKPSAPYKIIHIWDMCLLKRISTTSLNQRLDKERAYKNEMKR